MSETESKRDIGRESDGGSETDTVRDLDLDRQGDGPIVGSETGERRIRGVKETERETG